MEKNRRTAKKSLGQNFLVSDGAIKGIISAVTADDGLPVFEIGPGKGALTIPLAEGGTQIAAFEIDEALAEETAGRLEGFTNAEIVLADFRGVDLDAEAAARGWEGYALAGNIPYLLTSTILLGLPPLERCRRAVIMVQKEVGERILATPGSRNSGILPVFLQSYLAVKKVMTLKPGSFRPKPKVDSVVLIFAPVSRENAPGDYEGFLLFLKSAFSQRRKKLSNALKKVPGIPEAEQLERISGVDLSRRPEELLLEEWFTLFAAAKGSPEGR
jgi:16S rRNA (adenine1518-N6/adenine1519-N6)-dimethyltransferase